MHMKCYVNALFHPTSVVAHQVLQVHRALPAHQALQVHQVHHHPQVPHQAAVQAHHRHQAVLAGSSV